MNFRQVSSEKRNLFFGLNFSKTSTKSFCEITHSLVDGLNQKSRGSRFSKTRQENLHLTLYFLGSELDYAVKDSLLREADELISKIQKNLDKQIQKLHCLSELILLPSPKKPRALVVKPSPSEGAVLGVLHEEIAQVVETLLGGSSRNQSSLERKFFPHVTIARIRSLQSRQVFKDLGIPSLPALSAPKINLFESAWEIEKDQKKIVYRKLK